MEVVVVSLKISQKFAHRGEWSWRKISFYACSNNERRNSSIAIDWFVCCLVLLFGFGLFLFCLFRYLWPRRQQTFSFVTSKAMSYLHMKGLSLMN